MNDQFLAGPGSDEPDEDPSLLASRATSAQIAATHASLSSVSASTASTLPTQSQYDLLKAGYSSMKADLEMSRQEHLTTSITAATRLDNLAHTVCSDYALTRKVGWYWVASAVLSFILCVWVTRGSGWGYGTASTLIASVSFLAAGLSSFYTSSLKLKALASAKEAADGFRNTTDHLTKEMGT